MSFEVSNKGGRYEVLLHAGERATALHMAPNAIEPALTQGRWLVLAFAVWSAPDREAIQTLLDASHALPDQLRIGVRPFDSHEENANWCPEISERHGSPLWLVLDRGSLVAERVGRLSEEELVAWADSLAGSTS